MLFHLWAHYFPSLEESTFPCHLNFLTPSYSFLSESPQNSHSLWRCVIWRKHRKLSLLIEKNLPRLRITWKQDNALRWPLEVVHLTLLAHQRWTQSAHHPCRYTLLSTSTSTEWRSLPYPSKLMMDAIYWMFMSPQN